MRGAGGAATVVCEAAPFVPRSPEASPVRNGRVHRDFEFFLCMVSVLSVARRFLHTGLATPGAGCSGKKANLNNSVFPLKTGGFMS